MTHMKHKPETDAGSTKEISSLFERGVADYFRDFGYRKAREAPHQAWLLISLSKYISPKLVIGELQVPNQDLRPFVELKDTGGAVNFDFGISRSEIDLRTWKSRTPGWNQGVSTVPQTLSTLNEIQVLAELKLAASTSTTRKALVHDIRKMAAAVRFMEHNSCDQIPRCYFILLDPERKFDIDRLKLETAKDWPSAAPFPSIIVGPKPDAP